jgi:thiamine monophosphate synthase
MPIKETCATVCDCVQAGDYEQLRSRGVALDIMPHLFGELAVALGVESLHTSLGPIFVTTSNKVNCDTFGVEMVVCWRALIPSHAPLVVIGCIADEERVAPVRQAGAQVVAVSGARTKVPDVPAAGVTLSESLHL